MKAGLFKLESWLKGQKGNFRANSSLSFRAYSFLEDETFSQSGPLKEHERIHKEKSAFACSKCVQSFTNSGTLKMSCKDPHRTARVAL